MPAEPLSLTTAFADSRSVRLARIRGFPRKENDHAAESNADVARALDALARVEKELKMIDQLDYCGYFLISWDIVRYAQSRAFRHVGRVAVDIFEPVGLAVAGWHEFDHTVLRMGWHSRRLVEFVPAPEVAADLLGLHELAVDVEEGLALPVPRVENVLQAKLDATAARGAYADTPWVPGELKEVVDAFLGCDSPIGG